MKRESGAAPLPSIAIVGGTGKLGAAIARRIALAGYRVLIGSRDAAKAHEVASTLRRPNQSAIEGLSNADAAAQADIVVLALPYSSRNELLGEIKSNLAGKLVIDTTVPLRPPKVMRVELPEAGSAALETQALLGANVTVAAAFHNVAAHKLMTDEPVDCDVLVFADDKAVRESVVTLVDACGLRGLHGGALANSAAAEALTSVLIFINRTYAVDGAGIRITGRLQGAAANR